MPPDGMIATVPKIKRPRNGSPLARHTIEELSTEKFQRLCSVLPTKRNWSHVDSSAEADFANQVDGGNKVNVADEATAVSLVADLLEQVEAKKHHGGPGFVVDPDLRKVIETYAVTRAKEYFKYMGFTKIEDVGKPYDLLCHKKNGEELHVEVKGTTTQRSNIILTYNEVEHVKRVRNACALYVLSEIGTEKVDGYWKAFGGFESVSLPWKIERRRLKPIAFQYEVGHKK
jgi:Domain of unknown function (DUF3883)